MSGRRAKRIKRSCEIFFDGHSLDSKEFRRFYRAQKQAWVRGMRGAH